MTPSAGMVRPASGVSAVQLVVSWSKPNTTSSPVPVAPGVLPASTTLLSTPKAVAEPALTSSGLAELTPRKTMTPTARLGGFELAVGLVAVMVIDADARELGR